MISTLWCRMWFVLILISWISVLLVSASALNAENPGDRQRKSNPTAQYQSNAQSRSPMREQGKSISTNQQTNAAEQQFRQETLRIAREQLRIAQEQIRIAADQAKTAADQARAAGRQADIYQWLLFVAVAEAVALVGTLIFTGISANAAKKSMDLLATSERPHVIVRDMSITDWDYTLARAIHCYIHNYGKTPGFLKRFAIRSAFSESRDLPGPPNYEGGILPMHGYVVPSGWTKCDLSGPRLSVDATNWERYKAGGKPAYFFFLFGFIEYEDLSGKLHTSGFNFMRSTDTDFVNAGDNSYWTYT